MATDRYPRLDEKNLSARQAEVYEAIVNGPRGEVAGPLRVWLHSPELAERAQALGEFARYKSGLEPRLSELAILVTARLWSSGFEWSHHAPIAARAGIDAAAIEAIGCGRRPVLDDGDAQAVFDVAVELHRDRGVSDATFARASEVLGTERLVDLVGICGYYTLISMTINAFAVPVDGGPELPVVDLAPEAMFRE